LSLDKSHIEFLAYTFCFTCMRIFTRKSYATSHLLRDINISFCKYLTC